MNEFFYVIIWIFGLLLLGIINFPLTYIIFNKLQDRGYAFSKSLFLILISLSVWLFGFLKFIKIDILLWIFLGILVIINVILFIKKKKEIVVFFKTNKKYLIIIELLFVAIFLSLLFVKVNIAEIRTGEKFHDMMVLSTINRSDFSPPEDAWLSGHNLNYYYFGHYIGVMAMKLFFTPLNIGYNLYLVLVFTLAFISIFSILYSLTKKYWPGIIGILLFFSGNFFAYLQISKYGLKNFDFWASSRVIEGTATEFPLFSFILGDLHAHLNVYILSFLFFALLLNYYLAEKRNYFNLIIIGLTLGAIYIAHSWDMPSYILLFLLIFLAKQITNNFKIINIIKIIIPAIFFFIIFSLHNFNIVMPIKGIGIVTGHTKISEYFFQFGLFMSMFIFLAILYFDKIFYYVNNIYKIIKLKIKSIPRIIKLIITFIIKLIITIIFFSLLLIFIIFLILNKELFLFLFFLLIIAIILFFIFKQNKNFSFCLILFILATILSIITEIIYINDFTVGIYDRFNTVFKFYMQIWLLFTICSAYFVYEIYKNIISKKTFLILIFCLISYSYLYLILTINSDLMVPTIEGLTSLKSHYQTIDGFRYFQDLYPGDYQAIKWLNENIKGQPVILTKAGDSYTLDSFTSTFTGLPTLIGWVGHEGAWRSFPSEINERVIVIDNLYRGEDVQNLIKKYQIEYVYIGALEKEEYPDNDFKYFEAISDLVYSNEDVKIYKVRKSL